MNPVNQDQASPGPISLNQRRWQNFRRNRRAFISLIVFSICFIVSLFAEILANDRPILVKYRDGFYMPVFQFYAEKSFGLRRFMVISRCSA